MASIFTYDPDPPRVDSPWLRSVTIVEDGSGRDGSSRVGSGTQNSGCEPRSGDLGDRGHITRLEAEPQEGPVEYKLHLLLRPRRKFVHTSTNMTVNGYRSYSRTDRRSTAETRTSEQVRIESGIDTDSATPPLGSTYQARQHRLQQLTTQLLWRLQQSSPHHASSATNIILPTLPEPLPELHAPTHPAKLLHGLEESRGALYEIGVADDGTLVGLAEDEMRESLNNLRAMAACMGCTVEVLRREVVGSCEWSEHVFDDFERNTINHTDDLVVVEALVKPSLQMVGAETEVSDQEQFSADVSTETSVAESFTEQLRVTLAGPTMCGKSSLLGTLTTSTMDNGRGQSRISMLKHRHELSSGVTSSVTQELMGYADRTDGSAAVINYAAENTASWIDIHAAATGCRLVFISDSAGHPRYRRTTLRGLVGWAPHWTLLCVPADYSESKIGRGANTSALQQLGPGISDMDLSLAQLDLCMRLRLPLVVIITKLDLASKPGLKETLTQVLDALKASGRRPVILPNLAGDDSGESLQCIPGPAINAAYHMALPLLNNPLQLVPIVLTSAVSGTGVQTLHALLHELPVPEPTAAIPVASSFLFHIEDVYSRPAGEEGVVVSGRVRRGRIDMDQVCFLGPFSSHEVEAYDSSDDRTSRGAPTHLPTSRSFPGAFRPSKLTRPHLSLPNEEWRRCKVTTIRNLRLPVRSLLVDQVGTLAVVLEDAGWHANLRTGYSGIRKGMLLAPIQPQATRTFVAEFKREDLTSLAVGNQVVAYSASARASARIISARTPDSPDASTRADRWRSSSKYPFDLDADGATYTAPEDDELHHNTAGSTTASSLLVTFAFEASKEFLLVEDQVLVMPGGGPGLYGGHERGEKGVAGLEGYVGIIRAIDEYI